MTETQRPTQDDLDRALESVRGYVGATGPSESHFVWDRLDTVEQGIQALAAEKKALEERVRDLVRHGTPKDGHFAWWHKAADDAKAAGEPETKPYRGPDGDELPWNLVREVVPKPDDRASRRRAYVRKHAARFLRAYIRAGCSADLSRANAIEQAGLIFDETEQSDG